MSKGNGMLKPGEKAPAAGTYECVPCRRRGERSTCEMKAGQLFLACPRCLERKVPEWDLIWRRDETGGKKRRMLPWPGSLAKSA